MSRSKADITSFYYNTQFEHFKDTIEQLICTCLSTTLFMQKHSKIPKLL